MKKKRILIVDDDRTTAAVIQLYLCEMGYDVLEIAINGSQAIANTELLAPDIVLMDINLGGSPDGIEVAEQIIKKHAIPIIYITAHHDDDTLQRARRTNPAGFINKPVRESDLCTSINFALGENKSVSTGMSGENTSLQFILGESYKLTPAEIRVVQQLLVDPDLDSISRQLAISVNTVRTHLKRAYRKTETKSKSALLLKIINDSTKVVPNQTK